MFISMGTRMYLNLTEKEIFNQEGNQKIFVVTLLAYIDVNHITPRGEAMAILE